MPTSKGRCSCCSRSTSSTSSSSSGQGSVSRSDSGSRGRSDSGSTSGSGSGSGSGSVAPSRCCAIPRKYLIREEVYPDYDDSLDWIRSQRQGRENTGIMFVGPVLLRDGQWYAAEVCMSPNNPDAGGGDGICDCIDLLNPDAYTCVEDVSPEVCYLDVGIPGTGKWKAGDTCEETNCSEDRSPCESGCSDCNCCYKDAPPAGQDGVACTNARLLLDYGQLKENYPEVLTDGRCGLGGFAPTAQGSDPNSVLSQLMLYVVSLGYDPIDVWFASFRPTASEPDECRVELWGQCACTIDPCEGGELVSIPKSNDVGGFAPDVRQKCSCEDDECVEECKTADDLGVDVLDEWQAGQIRGRWRDPAIYGECPIACLPPCDNSVLPPPVPYTLKESNDASGTFLDVGETSYERTLASPPATDFEWNPDWNPDGAIDYVWYREEVFSNAAYFDSGDPETGASHCVKYTLVACDRENSQWIDATSDAVIGKPGNVNVGAGMYPVDSLIDWGLTVITNFITDVGAVTEGCSAMPEVLGMEWFDVGQLDDVLPVEYEEPLRRKEENPLP